ncbi:MAG: RNA polymerase sigma factor [Verrucomicrobiales bacterium]|nr:RNA polymerase sigma factor [Verrucomicrobiales bacterium]
MQINDNTTSHTLNPDNWALEHRQFLIQLAYSKVNDYQIAEDLVQDAFISAWKSRDNFRGECSEKTYLAGILKNKVIDFYRRRGRRPVIFAGHFSEDPDTGQSEWLESQTDPRDDLSPMSVAEKKDFVKDLNVAVAKLPKKMRQAFQLSQIEDQTTEEVIQSMNISRGNLWVMIHRARKALSEDLRAEWGDASLSSGSCPSRKVA